MSQIPQRGLSPKTKKDVPDESKNKYKIQSKITIAVIYFNPLGLVVDQMDRMNNLVTVLHGLPEILKLLEVRDGSRKKYKGMLVENWEILNRIGNFE